MRGDRARHDGADRREDAPRVSATGGDPGAARAVEDARGRTMTIRRARIDDARFIARVILSAQRGHVSRGWFDIALDWPEPQCLAFVERIAIAQSQSWWHVSHFILAELEGEPAAALCAMPAAGTVSAGRSAIMEVAERLGMDASETAAIFRRGAYAARCWIQGGETDWLIEHVASLPRYRGRGLVQALID